MLTVSTFQKLYQEAAQMYLSKYDDVSCSRMVNYTSHNKIMHFTITADDSPVFHVIVEMNHSDTVKEWCFGVGTDPADAIYFQAQLNKFNTVKELQ